MVSTAIQETHTPSSEVKFSVADWTPEVIYFMVSERLKSFISWSVNAWGHLFHGQWMPESHVFLGQWTPEVIYFMISERLK